MLRMEQHWRMLMTREQIENISDYNNDLKYKSKHLIKEQAYQFYLMNGGKESFLRRRCEPRYIASKEKTSSFFLNSDLIQNHLMIDKVVSIAEEWRFLE